MAFSNSSGQKILKWTDFEKRLIGKMLENDIICSICLDTYKRPYGLDCNHVFCHKCLVNWSIKNNSCPMCRNTISKAPIKCEWLEFIIENLLGTSSPLNDKNHRRTSLISKNSSSLHRRSGKENFQRPPWK